jgi:predicted PurR-regulated permease PerM
MKERDVVIHISISAVVKVIVVLLLVATIFVLRDLLLIVLTAVVVASALEPIIRWFRHYKIPRLPAVVFVYLSAATVLIGSFYFLFLPLLNETSSFLSSLPHYADSVKLWEPFKSNTFIGSQQFVQDLSTRFSIADVVNGINQTFSNTSQGLLSTINTIFGGVLGFILIVVLSFYLAVQENGIGIFLKTVTPLNHQSYILDLWRRAEKKIGLWMQGQILLVVIVAVLTYLGLTLLGVKHALLLAVLAGLFEVIPIFGPILASIPALAISFVDGGVSSLLLIAGLYLIVQQFENHLIYPLVVRKVVGVPSIIVILALIAGYTLAGFLGVILSMPVAAVLMELFHDLQKDKEDREMKTKLIA